MMYFNPETHHRKSIRLPGYDYSRPGYYFVTVNLDNVRCMFARWGNGVLELLPVGTIVKKTWSEIPLHYPNVRLDEFIIMPDHIHGIIIITGKGTPWRAPTETGDITSIPLDTDRGCQHGFQKIIHRSLGMIINQFKSTVKRWCNNNGYPQFKWQRNYYEHIIGDNGALERIRRYIRHNPETFQSKFNGLKG